jgi:dienelactone hydrolase
MKVHAYAALALGLAALAGCAAAATAPGLTITTQAANGAREEIPASVVKPDGPGPFPAVVIMHDCSGLGPRSSGAPGRWASELVGRGYVVVIADSFTTRGFPAGVCTDASRGRANVGHFHRVRDAYAALAYARRLPEVDGARVGVMGGSHGGSTVLATMIAPSRDRGPIAADARGGFAAAVALYPACAIPGLRTAGGVYEPAAPLLILIGDKDDWTPAEPCRQLADAARKAGQPVAIKIYPGAHHSFDSPYPVRYVPTRINMNSPTGRGATTGGDPQAWADSIREVVEFFGSHLGGERRRGRSS